MTGVRVGWQCEPCVLDSSMGLSDQDTSIFPPKDANSKMQFESFTAPVRLMINFIERNGSLARRHAGISSYLQ